MGSENQTMKMVLVLVLAKLLKNMDKNINIGLKTSNKINNIIGNSIQNHNKFEKREVYKLTCNSCNKFYIGRTKRSFKTRFNENRRDFATSYSLRDFEYILKAKKL